ncbi:MAG: cysteine desulfurase [Rhodospirillaceae bacterium]|nr:cysteine desulfurase [Rhodospirillaceae bacterium]
MTAIVAFDQDCRSRNCYDLDSVRADFPILSRTVYDKPLRFLDNGASAQKPRAVIDAIKNSYTSEYANVHRGAHFLSGAATEAYEGVREKVASLLNASSPDTIVFTKNVTEAINLVAFSWAETFLDAGDEIVITEMEHHANIVPWQILKERKGLILRIAPVEDDGRFDLDRFAAILNDHTKLVSVPHVSNVLGTVVPIAEVTRLAKEKGACVLIDGAQGIVHQAVDVQALGCDFYAFTGHKLYGPTGIGVLYGKTERLVSMPPWQGGGDMIETVSFNGSVYAEPPMRFEAGTPPFVQAIGLGAAIDYVQGIGIDAIDAHEQYLRDYAFDALRDVPDVRLIGEDPTKAAIMSFIVDGIHSMDVGAVLDRQGLAVRVGHHCAQPLMARMGVEATVRASMALYNTTEEIDALAAGIRHAQKLLG